MQIVIGNVTHVNDHTKLVCWPLTISTKKKSLSAECCFRWRSVSYACLIKYQKACSEWRSCFWQLRLSVITGLDALLQTALKQADARATQAVCVCQWNACLPLLQHNLRKRVQKPLLTLARALEHSDRSETCSAHSSAFITSHTLYCRNLSSVS